MEVHQPHNPEPYSDMEVNQESYPEVYVPPHQEKAYVPQNGGVYQEPHGYQGAHGNQAVGATWKDKLWRMRWLIIGLGVAIVIASVVGGVVGSQTHKSSASKSASSTSNSTSSSTSSSAIASPTMSGTAVERASYSYPTAVSWGYPHLEIFAPSKNTSYGIYWKYRGIKSGDTTWNPTDGSLELVGGALATYDNSVAAVARGGSYVDIFQTGQGNDGGAAYVYEKNHVQNSTFLPTGPDDWNVLLGNWTTAPTVVAMDADREDVFVIATNNDLFQGTRTSSTASWSGWGGLTGNLSSYPPTAISRGEGLLDVFVVDRTTLQLLHASWAATSAGGTGVWSVSTGSGYDKLGGYLTSRPAAVSWAKDRMDVFARGGDAGLWHTYYNSTGSQWSNWTSISGNTSIQGEPEALSWGANRIDVFAWGTDSSLLHKSYDGTTWTPADGFESLGGSLGGPPKGVADAFGSLQVVYYDRFATVQHMSFNQTSGKWSSAEALGTPSGGIAS